MVLEALPYGGGGEGGGLGVEEAGLNEVVTLLRGLMAL
jgi:hypothetical protein